MDGPLFDPTICTISLGSYTLLDFYKPLSEENTVRLLFLIYLLFIIFFIIELIGNINSLNMLILSCLMLAFLCCSFSYYFFSFQNDLTCWKSRYAGSFLLEPRSLVCFKDDFYHYYLHGIENRIDDDLSEKTIINKTDGMDILEKRTRKTRVSVTIRHFPKTINLGLKFGNRR